MKKFLAGLLLGGLVAVAGFIVGVHFAAKPAPMPAAAPSFGSSFSPVEGVPYTVSKTILPTDTTITLSSFNTPPTSGGYPLSMANFGSIGYGTIDPNNLTRIESISFTGVTENSDGSVTLTGVSRGLSFVSPYAASTTLEQTHLVGSTFILSNTSAFYGAQFPLLNNPSTIGAVWTFGSTTPPTYDADPVWANFSTQVFADVSYVNSVVAGGAANASETVKGIVQLATAAQAALGTSLGSTGARLALGNNLATSTPGLSTVTGDVPTVTGNVLNAAFIDHTATYVWTALHTFSAGFLSTASTTITATTTIAASNVNSKALVLNGVPYAFPGGLGASSTVLSTNSTGALTWEAQTSSFTSTSTTFTFPNTGSVGKNIYCVPPQVAVGFGYSNLPGTAGSGSNVSVGIILDAQPIAPSPSGYSITGDCLVTAGSGANCNSVSVTIYATCINP